MVRPRIYGSDTEFCKWMRDHPSLPCVGDDFGFVASDNDLTIHRYKTCIDSMGTRDVQGIMQVEIKTRNGEPSDSQIDTLSKVNLFCGDRSTNGVSVRFFGVFVLSMSGVSPDCSDEMRWGSIPRGRAIGSSAYVDWEKVDVATLIDIMRFERHPRNLRDTKPFRRHHKTREFVEIEKTELGFDTPVRRIARS